ncbi:MAG: hypothetical protein M3Z07_03660 [Candidatus Eremiobacteraeota bacterium]|nr:hypothetical protein [Candidatus Eremiobacteraeota bacterium]
MEYASKHDGPAPPTIVRPPDASEENLREVWPQIELDLESARAYTKHLGVRRGTIERDDPSSSWLKRTVQELEQYARAIRWVLTVTEKP